jgi:hypothetical protein
MGARRGHKLVKRAMALAVGAALGISTGAHAYQSPVHTFSIKDVQGGFDGSTYGLSGAIQRSEIFCGLPGSPDCPTDEDGEPLVAPIVDREGVTLYPIDSQFGFYVVDFVGAQRKDYDDDYMEGWAGNITDGETVIGIKVSNAATDTYKVKPPLGTWCQGLGGTSVKCETEHYTVMEHVLSCHEVIPYFFADPVTGEHIELSTPDGSLTFNCADAPLDDNTLILTGGIPGERLINATPCEDVNDPEGCQMFPNDKTDMQNNVALSSDYSVQLKDDGKPLYGWGGLHKRPNDIRMYAKLQLPGAWKEEGADYVVTRAELVINHWITNNPNDQLRAEDLENEGATGRKPSYRVEGEPGTSDEVWKSTIPCFEGDGDVIDTEEGTVDPTFIGIGTVFKNMPFALSLEDPAPGTDPADPPYAFSSDLTGAFTNAFYTTINRDPFEWSYLAADRPEDEFNFIGCAGPAGDPAFAGTCTDTFGNPYPNVENLVLVSGPRWRLKPNKFGQDLPGLEIPKVECSPPPFERSNIKYVTGTPTTTVINLLDWNEDEGPSPLSTSKGWVDVTANEFVTVVGEVNGIPITSNGLPMTEDFDLAVYIKGDRKSTAVFNAQLFIEYEGEEPPAAESDVALSGLASVPSSVLAGAEADVVATVTNIGPDATTVCEVEVTGVANRGDSYGPFSGDCGGLDADESTSFTFDWTAPTRPGNVTWTATVTADRDPNPANDTATLRTQIRP